MKSYFLTLCAFIILLSFQKVAFASCGVKPSIVDATKQASVIFVGTVTKIVPAQTASASYPLYPPSSRKKAGWQKTLWNVDGVTFSVSEAFKGVESETIDVATGADGFAGYKFEGGTWLKEGQTYLVYAYKREAASKEIPKKLAEEINEFNSKVSPIESSVCTRTINIDYAAEELAQVRKIFPNAKRFSTQADAQQFNGREGETATLLLTSLVNSELRGGGFAPRHLKCYTPKGKWRRNGSKTSINRLRSVYASAV
ncbi:MAG: hypothetical protein LC768_12180 [Acidobacteria bacterium]|nr:hypothetical protein [Acidobacteriota bacterium]MCA1639069.1 hypothetical protein [Acidobacteriota bacterium]